MRVCPDGNSSPTDPATATAAECSSLYGDDPKPSTSNPASPSSTDSKNKFLFNGLLTPVVVTGWGDEADEGFITVTQLYNSMHDGQHCPYMFDPTYMLIIDTRVKEDFLKKHIVTARWVGELNEPMRLEELDAYTMIILYDHKGHSHNIKDSTLRQTLKELQAAGVEPFILVGGFDAFFQEHPYLCTHKVPRCEAERQQLIVPFPSIVLDGALYLGRGDQATCNHIVSHLRITHIVNVTRDHRMAFPRRIKYLHIPLDDDSSAQLLPEFPAAVRFIGAAIADGGRVLVHCNLGVSRSSTVVIAFLMYTRRWILRDARQYLKERRPIIHPNNAFYHQLSRFEEMLFGKKYTVIQELTI
jgi:serine/threonine/tyrosine-interacting-like protein 1